MSTVVETRGARARSIGLRRALSRALVVGGDVIDVLVSPFTLAFTRLAALLRTRCGVLAERALPGLGVWAFILTFAGQGVRDLVGWWGFGLVALVTVVVLALAFVAAGRVVSVRRLPLALSCYVVICALSVFWSAYPLESVVAAVLMALTSAVGVWFAIAFPMAQLLRVLSSSLKWMIGLSFVLELVVELVVGDRLAPLYMRNWEHIPDTYYWVNGLLFEGGPIQGVFANRNPLAFAALLLLVCVVMERVRAEVSWWNTVVWGGAAVATLALTRSATVMMALIACVAVAAVAAVVRRVRPERRSGLVRAACACALALVILGLFFHSSVTDALGRGSDFTGRALIWERLLQLWQMRPVLGWGWIMYWAPWVPLFRMLVIRPDGTPTMQGHNAWIEALFQTGLVGATVLVVAVVWIVVRTFRVAVRTIDVDLTATWVALLLTAFIVQSFTESRLLSEGNWVFLFAAATWLTVRAEAPVLEARPASLVRRVRSGRVPEGERGLVPGA